MGLIFIFSVVLIIVGIIGCFKRKIPGQLIVFTGVELFFWGMELPISWTMLTTCVALLVLSLYVTYRMVPHLYHHVHRFDRPSKSGTSIGAVVGIVIYLLFTDFWDNLLPAFDDLTRATVYPLVHLFITEIWLGFVMLLLLPFLFSLLFVIFSGKSYEKALKRTKGAYTIYLATTFQKLLVSFVFILQIFVSMMQVVGLKHF